MVIKMSQDILIEVYFLISSILMGIIITFVYDFILIGRKVARHSLFFISVEDFIFWTVCAVAVFYMLYKENNGILRWFAVAGAAFGMLLYKKIIGIHLVNIMSTVIVKEIHIVRKVISIIFKPLHWVIKKVSLFGRHLLRMQKKIVKYLKKRLTVFIKMLKITLCKH